MNSYKIVTNFEGTKNYNTYTTKANTPFDAAEKATNLMTKREKMDVTIQTVTILDGSQQEWIFKNE